MTHWRKYVLTDYISGDEIMDDNENYIDWLLTIKEIKNSEVVDPNNGRKQTKGILYFNEIKKGLILNVINGTSIAKSVGSSNIESWIGKPISIFGKVDKRHGRVVRVRSEKQTPATLPELLPNTDNWTAVEKALSNGFTIDQIKTKYSLSAENEAALKK